MLKTIVPEVNTNKWADLPIDILKQILKHGHDLNTDLTRLRAVCPSWRSALHLEEHSFFRSHIQVPSLAHGTWRDRPFTPLFLLETSFYLFSPINPCGEGSSDSSGWVVRMGQIAPNKWRLLNPLSYNDDYKPVANGNEYLFTDPPIIGEINLLDCRVFLLSKALTLVDEVNFNAKPISTKVVGEWDLTSSTRPLSGFVSSKLLLLRPNDAQRQQNEWVEISESDLEDKKQNNLVACDIAYCNGMFFVFQSNSDRWQVGTVNPSNNTSVLKPFACGGIRMTFWCSYLVPSNSNGCLYLVLSPSFGGKQCHCFLNEYDGASVDESNKREIINKLGDKILFCSSYVSFSFRSSTLLNNNTFILKDKNSMAIFYMDSNHVCFNKLTPGNSFLYSNLMPEGVKGLNLVKHRRYKYDISFWLTTEKNISEISVLDFDVGKNRVFLFDGMPITEQEGIYTRLFFPPPAWVKWRCPNLDNVDINLHDLKDENPLDYVYPFYNIFTDSDVEYYVFDYVSS